MKCVFYCQLSKHKYSSFTSFNFCKHVHIKENNTNSYNNDSNNNNRNSNNKPRPGANFCKNIDGTIYTWLTFIAGKPALVTLTTLWFL